MEARTVRRARLLEKVNYESITTTTVAQLTVSRQ